MLRLGDQSFRTCLTCLGQGSLPGVEPGTTMAELISPVAAVMDASVSAAR